MLYADETMQGGDPKSIKPMELVYANVIQNPKFGVNNENDITLGQKNDRFALSYLIFDMILQIYERMKRFSKLCLLCPFRQNPLED